MSEYLHDVYDEDVWKTFNSEEYNNFLSTPYSYLLNMNVDWFKPFVHGTAYSTGAVYLTIQNLPSMSATVKKILLLLVYYQNHLNHK